jgi:outer membrane protein OmpA-like peptidoglycan-associated protein
MKISRIFLAFLFLITVWNVSGQQMPPSGTPSVAKSAEKKDGKKHIKSNNGNSSKLIFTGGIGITSYIGDLIKSNTAFRQSSYSFTAGLNYVIATHINARFDIGFNQVQGYDNRKGGAHIERNLSFKSQILEFSLAGEYTFANMNTHKFSPYIFAGIGTFHFNPRAYNGPGGTYNLRELGTEGQGLAGYNSMYSTMAVEFPLGLGIKYKINNKITLLGEFNYRITSTDYLDDVSTFYPDKAQLDARNPQTAKFTFRGDGPYPKNPALKRGDASNKDAYYTTQLKIAYNLGTTKKKKNAETKVALPVKGSDTDTDGDGITDVFDKCPAVKGSKENSGCPFPFVDGAELAAVSADSMTYRIYFDVDRSLLSGDAFKTLQGIVAILKADNTLSVNITGHSDNTGTSAANMQLSVERANITRDYFLSYNIAADRLSTAYYGETVPLDDVQQWRNRRVEVTIIKK